jgi:glycosyltransferase involved in cell wall biosynthesis
MKIAILVFFDLSENNGTTVRARRVYKVLKKDFAVTLVGGKIKGRNYQSFDQVKYISLPRARQFFQIPIWLVGLFRILLKNRFEVVICSNDWFGFIVVFLLSLVYKYHVVFEAHGILSEEYRVLGRSNVVVQFARLLEKQMAKRASAIVALSQGIFDFYGKYNTYIELIPVFVDTNHYKVDDRKRQELRKTYLGSARKLVGLIGPFDCSWNKHYLEFLYHNLHNFDPNIKFVAIGRYNRQEIKDVADQRVVCTGYVDDYVGYLSCLDAVIVPSRLATSGPLNKILEPMSCSLPVFTTSAGLVGLDYVQPGKDIFVAEEDLLPSLINRCVFDEELMQVVGNNARKTVMAFYDALTNSERLVKLVAQYATGADR